MKLWICHWHRDVREVSQKLTYYPDEISIKPFTNCKSVLKIRQDILPYGAVIFPKLPKSTASDQSEIWRRISHSSMHQVATAKQETAKICPNSEFLGSHTQPLWFEEKMACKTKPMMCCSIKRFIVSYCWGKKKTNLSTLWNLTFYSGATYGRMLHAQRGYTTVNHPLYKSMF